LEALRQYELMFIVDPDAADDEVAKLTESLKQIVTDQGGTVTKEELERRMRVSDRILRYLTVRLDEDRRRADKLKDRRARKAAKRPFAAAATSRGATAPEFPAGENDEA